MGLLWSLRPVPGSKPGLRCAKCADDASSESTVSIISNRPSFLRMRKKNVQTPMEVTVSVYQGLHTQGFADLLPLSGVVVERWYMAPGVSRIPITEGGLTATLFLPSGERRVQREVSWGCNVDQNLCSDTGNVVKAFRLASSNDEINNTYRQQSKVADSHTHIML